MIETRRIRVAALSDRRNRKLGRTRYWGIKGTLHEGPAWCEMDNSSVLSGQLPRSLSTPYLHADITPRALLSLAKALTSIPIHPLFVKSCERNPEYERAVPSTPRPCRTAGCPACLILHNWIRGERTSCPSHHGHWYAGIIECKAFRRPSERPTLSPLTAANETGTPRTCK